MMTIILKLMNHPMRTTIHVKYDVLLMSEYPYNKYMMIDRMNTVSINGMIKISSSV